MKKFDFEKIDLPGQELQVPAQEPLHLPQASTLAMVPRRIQTKA